MTRKSLPKYVYNDRGYLRFIRRSRGISVMMHEEAGTPEFWDHYNRLLKGKPAPAPVKRNFEALILSYYESDAYKKLKPRTRSDYRRISATFVRSGPTKTRRGSKPITSTNCTAPMRITSGKPTILFRSWSS